VPFVQSVAAFAIASVCQYAHGRVSEEIAETAGTSYRTVREFSAVFGPPGCGIHAHSGHQVRFNFGIQVKNAMVDMGAGKNAYYETNYDAPNQIINNHSYPVSASGKHQNPSELRCSTQVQTLRPIQKSKLFSVGVRARIKAG
jgi:hypothetical protein